MFLEAEANSISINMKRPLIKSQNTCALLLLLFLFSLGVVLFTGQFKEKASILHKMAKHKCKEEAAANGVGE